MFSSIEYNIYYKGHINYRIQNIESHRNKKKTRVKNSQDTSNLQLHNSPT